MSIGTALDPPIVKSSDGGKLALLNTAPRSAHQSCACGLFFRNRSGEVPVVGLLDTLGQSNVRRAQRLVGDLVGGHDLPSTDLART